MGKNLTLLITQPCSCARKENLPKNLQVLVVLGGDLTFMPVSTTPNGPPMCLPLTPFKSTPPWRRAFLVRLQARCVSIWHMNV